MGGLNMNTFKEIKFKVIKNFLSKEETSLLNDYCIIKHKNNRTNFDINQNNNGDTFFYSDSLMTSLLKNKLPLVEKETGLKLFPTYALWRMYSMFSDLKKHTDRPSCEISVTVMIGSDGTKWPIYMNGQEVHLEAGDAAAYLGCEVEHWREEFIGDYHIQTFLHYVDINGPYANYKFDRMDYLGQVR